MDHIKNSVSDYCIGHWELNGFWFYKGLRSHGLEPDFLKRYKEVWSGHFHTISKAANVTYLGTPYTLTAGDENDERGFWVFDTTTLKSTFVKNPNTWHKRIHYPATDLNVDDYKNISVRVIVEQMDKNLSKFESELEAVVHEMRVISKIDNSLEVGEGQEEVEIKSVADLMDDYIEALPECSEDDKIVIKQYAKQLWVECTS